MTKTARRPVETDTAVVPALVAAQKRQFASDATKPLEWRLDQLDRLERLLVENADTIAAALAADFKTANFEIAFEIGSSLGMIAEAKEQIAEWMEPAVAELPPTFAAEGYTAKIYHDPYGVCLVIVPFNAPLILLLAPLVVALSAGNTVVAKPSEVTGNTATTLAGLFERYFEPENVAIVLGGRTVVEALLEEQFDFILFTGSVPVAKVVMRAAAEHLTPVVLELGGHNPSIVDETANVADAARKLVWGAMAFGGQWCVSPGYVYVHESVADAFVEAARQTVRDFYGDDPKTNPDLSRIATSKDVVRLQQLIDPDKVVAGGSVDAEARYVAPTLLYPVEPTDKVMEREIFGPILPILRYDDLDAVLQEIRSRPAALAAYVFSTDEERTERLLTSLPFGGGGVNQTILHCAFASLPFGGVGASGIGHYQAGRIGFETFTHKKSVLVSPADKSVDVVYPPYDQDTPARFAKLMTG